MSNAGDRIIGEFKPKFEALEEQIAELKSRMEAIKDEITKNYEKLEVEIHQLGLSDSKLLKELLEIKAYTEPKSKKAAAKMPAVEAVTTGPAVAKTAAAKKTAPAKASAVDVSPVSVIDDKFPNTKMAFFEINFINDPEFHDKFMTPEMQAAIDNTPAVKKAKTEMTKNKASAKAAWTFLKNENGEKYKLVDELFKAAKAEYEAQAKNEQQEVESD